MSNSNLGYILAVAAYRRQKGIPYPVKRDTLSYPIDISNHFCELDCAFDARLRVVDAALTTAVPEASDAARKMITSLEGFKHKLDPLFLSYQQMDAAEYMLDAYELSGEPMPVEKAELETLQKEIRENELITQTDQLITAAEHMLGIRKGPVPKEAIDACKASGMDFDFDAYNKQRQQPAASITSLPLTFECMDAASYIDAIRYSDPNRYAPTDKDITYIPTDTREIFDATPATMESYEEYVTNAALKTCERDLAIFDQLDAAGIRTRAGGEKTVTREDLIYINGCSLRQLVDLQYLDSNPTPEERKEAVTSILSQAVMHPEECYVQAFLPDNENLEISKSPVPVTALGEKVQEMEAPKMNAWQRFWAKHGHYKELAARLKQYETIQEYKQHTLEAALPLITEASDNWERQAANNISDAATQRVREANEVHNAIAANLFGEDFLDPVLHGRMLPDSKNYRVERAAVNLGICLLLTEGEMSVEQVMDPDYEPDQKRLLGNRLWELAERDDPSEFVDFVLPAARQIVEMPNIEMDYTNPMDILNHLEEIQLRSLTFDMFQETTISREHPVRQEVASRVDDMEEYEISIWSHGDFYNRLNFYANCLKNEGAEVNHAEQDAPTRFAHLAVMSSFLQQHGDQINSGSRPQDLGNLGELFFAMQVSAHDMAVRLAEQDPAKLDRAIEIMTSGRNCMTFTRKDPENLLAGFEVTIEDPAEMKTPEPVKAKKADPPVKAPLPSVRR